ncbi:rhodanese-like domain-containing protein [Alkalibacillus aidingensis]|uniref:rhodanese-like domain-containing protein n=1 Tax=Alkalibacillus aidingensis TaxID=2747607 RepID=UPI001660797C|nr:rhodanese-like domain-containing protein [Alkalibacillus aidingensis]
MKKYILILLTLLLTMLISACGSGTEAEADFQTIELNEVLTKQEEGFTIVDVREHSEYEAGHIEGAINKPLSELKDGDFDPLQPDLSYVIICETGNRSAEASEILADEGFDVVNVADGMSSWDGKVVD